MHIVEAYYHLFQTEPGGGLQQGKVIHDSSIIRNIFQDLSFL